LEEAYFKKDDWCNVVALLPPTSAECMSVPISRLRKWLTEEDAEPEGDLLGTATDVTKGQDSKPRNKTVSDGRVGVLWRGSKESQRIRSVDQLRPGDTLVLPVSAGGWDALGHVPEATVETIDKTIDMAETAFQSARDRAVLRLHPALKAMQHQRWPNRPWEQIDEFFARLIDLEDPPSEPEVRQRLKRIAEGWPDFDDRKFLFEYYPDERGVVLITRKRLDKATEWFTISDEGEDERSQTLREEPVTLTNHTQHVHDETVRTVKALPLDDLQNAYRLAAKWHDLGKADERFQAILRRTDRTDAWLLTGLDTALLAKSDGLPQTPQLRKQARERADLPDGFRHEMLSVQLVEHSNLRELAGPQLDLILHLIAAHHGYARPFAPVVIDEEYPEVTVNGVTLTSERRTAFPPHRIDSGIAERFWDLTRCYGWWGLAYLEAVLRLSDQQASADEDEGLFNDPSASVELAEAVS
jgi:CRISPR-associated endonuclease/helicase Cas3